MPVAIVVQLLQDPSVLEKHIGLMPAVNLSHTGADLITVGVEELKEMREGFHTLRAVFTIMLEPDITNLIATRLATSVKTKRVQF
jgi:hypothetical protein